LLFCFIARFLLLVDSPVHTRFPFTIQMTFRRNHFDKTVRLGHMTNVIVVTNPDYRLAPVYHYSLFTLQVIGNFYIFIFFPIGCFSFWALQAWGVEFVFFFCIFSPNILFIFFILFFTFSSLGYIFFLFFFPCMDLVKTTNCKLKVGQGTAQRGTRYMVKQERKGRKKKVKHFRTTSLVFFFCKP